MRILWSCLLQFQNIVPRSPRPRKWLVSKSPVRSFPISATRGSPRSSRILEMSMFHVVGNFLLGRSSSYRGILVALPLEAYKFKSGKLARQELEGKCDVND
jgi:hypothetical protein